MAPNTAALTPFYRPLPDPPFSVLGPPLCKTIINGHSLAKASNLDFASSMVDLLQITERPSHCLRDYRQRVKDSNKSPPQVRLVLVLSTLPAAVWSPWKWKRAGGELNDSSAGKTKVVWNIQLQLDFTPRRGTSVSARTKMLWQKPPRPSVYLLYCVLHSVPSVFPRLGLMRAIKKVHSVPVARQRACKGARTRRGSAI